MGGKKKKLRCFTPRNSTGFNKPSQRHEEGHLFYHTKHTAEHKGRFWTICRCNRFKSSHFNSPQDTERQKSNCWGFKSNWMFPEVLPAGKQDTFTNLNYRCAVHFPATELKVETSPATPPDSDSPVFLLVCFFKTRHRGHRNSEAGFFALRIRSILKDSLNIFRKCSVV